MIRPLRMPLQLLGIEVNLAQTPTCIPRGLIVEVRRLWIAALAASSHRPRPDLIPKLHHRNKAVPAGAIPLLGSGVLPRAKRSQRSPQRRNKRNRNARACVVKGLHDVASQPLKAIDLSPRR